MLFQEILKWDFVLYAVLRRFLIGMDTLILMHPFPVSRKLMKGTGNCILQD